MLLTGTLTFVFVIPRILDLYQGNDYALPLATRIILSISDFVSTNPLQLLLLIMAGAILSYMIWRTKRGHYQIHAILLRLPIIAPIIKKINIARISRLLHSLIVTDIPVVTSYEMVAQTLGNPVYRKHLFAASKLITEGGTIYSTFAEREDLFDSIVAQMIKVGETTGSLDDITGEIADFSL